jgi:hypothetical protein
MMVVQRVLLKNEALMSRSRQLTHDLPAGPPPEVQDEVAAAWERAQRPILDDLLLDFESEPALGRAWGRLLTPDGHVVAPLSAMQVLAIACGDAAGETAPVLAV